MEALQKIETAEAFYIWPQPWPDSGKAVVVYSGAGDTPVMAAGAEYASEIRVKVDIYHADPVPMRTAARLVNSKIEEIGYLRDGYTEHFDADSGNYCTTIYFKTLSGGNLYE